MYHLHKNDKTGVGYFRWKEDICSLIEENWAQLCPNKARTASWMNSVSSVLSANTSVFESGFERLKQPGWWALKAIHPPRPVFMGSAEGRVRKRKIEDDEKVNIEDFDASATPPTALVSRSPSTVETAHTLILSKHLAERIPNVNALLPSATVATPTTVKAAQEIKRKLVERLLRVDSKLLQEALANSQVPTYVSTPQLVTHHENSTTSKVSDPKPVLRETKPRPHLPELRRPQKISKPANYVRASPHENELLELCLRVAFPDEAVSRFKRKLIMRRVKRRVGLQVFDIDAYMYHYLKSNSPLSMRSRLVGGIRGVDRHPVEANQTFFDIPYHRYPALSFRSKLEGVSNVLEPKDFISPYTGLRLPAFLHREYGVRTRKGYLLNEISSLGSSENSKVIPIDFIHVRREWLPQVNRLLQEHFWPAIDMTECLDYPDYGVLVMYKKLVIGCAFLTPDGYMTYFFIHPDWSDRGLGSMLLYLIVTRVAPKHLDITLHVSVTNPAMLLYQRFGFKPEEYVINFYDKYFRATESSQRLFSKNAFLMRYRRG